MPAKNKNPKRGSKKSYEEEATYIADPSKEGIPKEKLQKEIQKFVKECKHLVKDYRQTLIVAPGVLNKLKDAINRFLEACTRFEKRYPVKETDFGTKIRPFFDKVAKYGDP